MFATLITLSLLVTIVGLLTGMAYADSDKILAALEGQSWTSQQPAVRFRPMTVRLESTGERIALVSPQTSWRAAA